MATTVSNDNLFWPLTTGQGIRIKVTNLETSIEDLHNNVNALQDENRDLRNEVNGLQDSITNIQSESDRLKDRVKALEDMMTSHSKLIYETKQWVNKSIVHTEGL